MQRRRSLVVQFAITLVTAFSLATVSRTGACDSTPGQVL